MNQILKEHEFNLLKELLGKRITTLVANDVSFVSGQYWFDAYSLRIKSIPSYGYVEVRYDFNEIDFGLGFSHSLVVEQVDFSKSSSTVAEPPFSFKMAFQSEFIINQIILLGQEFLMLGDKKTRLGVEHNELLILSDAIKILVVPEYTTARTVFTTDKKTIENYLESGWKKNENKHEGKRIEFEVK